MSVATSVYFSGALLGGLVLGVEVLAAQAPPPLRLREELRIDGADQEHFGLDVTAVRGPRGEVAVFGGGKVVVYDAGGRRIAEAGGRGAGPGEFMPSPVGMFLVRLGSVGDSIWALDRIQRRFTILTWAARVVRTSRYPEPDTARSVSFEPMGLLSGNRVIGRAALITARGEPDNAIVLLSGTGAVDGRIADVPIDSTLAVYTSPDGRRRSSPVPFRWDPRPASSPNGQRVALLTIRAASDREARARLTVVSASGDTVFSRTFDVATQPVTRSMADSALNRLAAITARTPELARILRERLPRFVAPFQNPIVGDDGTVWLPRNVAAGEPATFLVFTPRGDLRGEVAMPRPRMRATFVTSSDALALETTDDGFVDVLLLRVEVGAR